MSKNDFTWGGTSPFFHLSFVSSFMPDLKNKRVLDCGCGKGINAYLMRATRDLFGGQIIGLDANQDYLDYCRTFNVYDKLIKNSLPKLPFRRKGIDVLVCTEVIEHLKKKNGRKFLKEVERVTKERAIITTPNVFFDTHPADVKDKHRSLWSANDFREMGYKVYGMGFKLAILSGDPLIRLKQVLSYIFTPLSYLVPEISGSLICIKDFK